VPALVFGGGKFLSEPRLRIKLPAYALRGYGGQVAGHGLASEGLRSGRTDFRNSQGERAFEAGLP